MYTYELKMLNSMKVHFRLIGKIKIKRKGKTPIDCFVFNYLGQVCAQLEDSFSFLDFVQLYIGYFSQQNMS